MINGAPFSLFTFHFSRCYQFPLRLPRRHLWSLRPPEHIHLAADAELPGQIDARLHRKADPRPQPPVVVGLVIVQIRTGTVQVAVDRVPGTVHEPLPEARSLDHPPRGTIGLEAGDWPALRRRIAHRADRRIARIANHSPDLTDPRRRIV